MTLELCWSSVPQACLAWTLLRVCLFYKQAQSKQGKNFRMPAELGIDASVRYQTDVKMTHLQVLLSIDPRKPRFQLPGIVRDIPVNS